MSYNMLFYEFTLELKEYALEFFSFDISNSNQTNNSLKDERNKQMLYSATKTTLLICFQILITIRNI